MSTKDEKQYGLILPGKNKTSTSLGIRKLNPLQDSDDELENDEESTLNWVEASLKKSAGNSGQQNLQRRLVREALEEDASVFQYDEIYDEMQANKSAQIAAKRQAEEKKPKYIQNIIKQADKRKLEGERRTERKVQKEREEEGDMFADKESFVTPSYLKKMEELKKAEAEAKLEEMQEERIDVMKHQNFGAFYSHLFKQKMGESSVKKETSSDGDDEGKGIIKKREDPKRQKHYRTQRDLSESPEREKKGRAKAIKQEASSSDSNDESEAQSYRERRDKHHKSTDSKKDDDKGKSKDDRNRERGQSQERARDRNKSDERGRNDKRDKKHGRERSHERDRNNRGRHRSRSRDLHRRNSKSKSPPNKRDDRRRKESRSRSPQKSSKTYDKTKVKEEPKSPDRKEKKERKDENSKQDRDDEIARKANVKVKKESELEDKETRMERIRKLFTKRTVGEKFDQSLQRFYRRKSEREANG